MEPWGWVSMAAGTVLVLWAAADLFFTTLHPDVEGTIATAVQRSCWRVVVALGNRLRRARRQLLAFAGPFMVVLTFAAWILMFVVGIALIVWPNLGMYRAESEFEVLTFLDALYYAGITFSVLGYGDITPMTGSMQTLAWVTSATGFGVLTGIVTYILELVSSVDLRGRLALQVHDETGGTERGVQLVLRHVTAGSADRLDDRYDQWADLIRQAQDKLHRYALTSLYYRSRDPAYDPEAALRVVGEAVAAGYLLTGDATYRQLRPAVEHLDVAANRLMGTVAQQYLGDAVKAQIEEPHILDTDRRWVEAMRAQMQEVLGDRWQAGDVDAAAVAAAARLRHFLVALSAFSDWSADDGPLPTAEADHGHAPAKGVS